MGKRSKEAERRHSRRKYRKKHGIPLDAPKYAYRNGEDLTKLAPNRYERQKIKARERYRLKKIEKVGNDTDKEIINGRLRLTQEAKQKRREQRNTQRFTNHKYEFLVRGAKYRKLECNLTKEEFLALNSKPCFYCNGELPKYGSGLDRLDSTKGYIITNVVPCCTKCNITKSNKLSPDEMKNLIEYRKTKASGN